MTEPTYGSGSSYEPDPGYGQAQGYGGAAPGYGGPSYGQPGQPGAGTPGPGGPPPRPGQPAPQGQQPVGSGPYGGAAYPSGAVPRAQQTRRAETDRMALVAMVVTIVGYVCAGAGVLGFILWLTITGDGTAKFVSGLQMLVTGLGLGGLNVAVGAWLAGRSGSTPK